MRHKSKAILASLLVGSLINVIVAWGLALAPLSHRNGVLQPQVGFPESPWPVGAPENESSVCYQEIRIEHFGVTRMGFSSGFRQGYSSFDADVVSRRYGFPARSLEISVFFNFPGSTDFVWGSLDISAIHKMLGLSKNIQTGLPVQPRPLGFAINTIVYALPVYVIWIGFAALRKRRRLSSSICTRCGYDVSGVGQCPECGMKAGSG